MAVRVMHRLSVKFCAAFRWVFATCWIRPVIALAIIKVMIDMSVEMLRPMKPGTRANEYTTNKPLRPIITIRSAVVRGYLIVPVRTNRCRANFN
jgi:hypothetical protein